MKTYCAVLLVCALVLTALPAAEAAGCTVANCQTCSAADGKCETCKSGYNLYAPSNLCVKAGECVPGEASAYLCSQCATDNPLMCVKCEEETLVLIHGFCTNCEAQHCRVCKEGDRDNCAVGGCKDGYTLLDGVCTSPCNVEHCTRCVRGNPEVCAACETPFILYNENGWSLCNTNCAVHGGGVHVPVLVVAATLLTVVSVF